MNFDNTFQSVRRELAAVMAILDYGSEKEKADVFTGLETQSTEDFKAKTLTPLLERLES